MRQQKKITKKHGITLISLVITIVIMLILAGVAISIAVGDGSVTQHAENAAEKWGSSVINEQISIDEALSYLPGSSPSDLPEGWDSTKVADVVEEESTNRKAPIPVGYTASQISTEDEISEGLVIYQTATAVTGEPNSEAHITAMEGINQYVWIPVDDINDMVMCKKNGNNGTCNLVYDVTSNQITCQTHGYSTATELSDDSASPNFIDTTGLAGRLYGMDATDPDGDKIYTTSMAFTQASKDAHKFTTQYREPDLVTSKDNSNYQLVLNESSQALESANALKHQLNKKFIEMAKSVAKYGGFYVSRYEAGANGASLKNQQVLVAGTSTATNHNPDTYINGNMWYGMYNILMSSTAIDKTAVNSHMIWGCQYDQIIKFLSENSINDPQTGHTTRQLDAQKLTGETSTDIMSNIYDLEGNNCEWTAQADNALNRVLRGGWFSDVAYDSSFYPASYRLYGDYPTNARCRYASRSTLYIK